MGLGPWNTSGCDTEFQPDLQAWVAAGIVPIFRPGSNGPACSTMGSPGDLPEAFTAVATDMDDDVSSSSSRGPSCWGEVKPGIPTMIGWKGGMLQCTHDWFYSR